jgi:cell wall assembly regulator SMI1
MSGVKTFFDSLGLDPGQPATKARLDKLEKAVRLKLPDDFRELYRTANGFSVDGGSLEFIEVDEVESMADLAESTFGWLPFAHCNDSNYYSVACNEPLRGFVAHLYHDDESKLVCRSLGRFLDVVAEREARRQEAQGSDDEDEVAEQTRLDFIDGDLALAVPERTEEDVRAACEVVRLASGLDAGTAGHNEALRYAAFLFGAGNEDDLAGLFAHDEYVRETALRRLQHLGTPRATQVIASYRNDLAAFVERTREALRAAGLRVRGEGYAITVDPGNVHLNVEMLYSKRDDPTFLEGLIARLRR